MQAVGLPEAVRATLAPEVLAYLVALEQQIAALRAELAEVRAQVDQHSGNSSRPPSSDPPWKRPKRPSSPSGRAPGGQPGHPGHHRELLPPEQVDRVIVVVPEQCRECGAALAAEAGPDDPAEERRQTFEIPPVAVQVQEYRLAARRCRQCGRVTRAAPPPEVGDSSCEPRLQGIVALLTGRYRVTRREVVSLLRALWGIRLGLGSITRLEQATSAALAPVVAEARQAVQRAPAAHLDETGWQQGHQPAWLWTMVTATLTIFVITPRRVGAVARELLGEAWNGVVGSDRFSGYAWLPVCWRQVCWAHLKRDFQALIDRGGEAAPIGTAALAVERQVFELWHRFRRGEIDRVTLQREMSPLQRQLERVVVQGRDGGLPKVAGLCGKLLALWPALWTFVRVQGVEPTNNAAEQALRPAVLWRKGSFGTHSPEGSRFVERMLTVSATCRQQERNLLDFLVTAIRADRLGATPPSLVAAPQS